MNTADILIRNATLLTLDPGDVIHSPGAVAVRGDRIAAVGPEHRFTHWQAEETVDAGGDLVMPGLINAHTHLPMSLFRGLADDLPLEQWLQEHIFPAEARFITPRTVPVSTRLAVAEMLLSGTTCCCDGYFLEDIVAETVARAGMRAVLAQGVIDFPAPGVPDPSRAIEAAGEYVQRWQERTALIHPSIFCHAPYTCSAETLRAAKAAARQLGVRFQIHVAETQSEERQRRQTSGCSSVAYLHSLGLLDKGTLLVHAVWVDAADIALITQSGASVVHCPESNMKLASGVAPIPDMLQAGIPVGLGTDGCASNNDLDMLGEMDSASKLHKVQRLDPTVMDAAGVVRMATCEGARALGLDHLIGSLEVGKQADLIIVDVHQPHASPLYRAYSHLVYAARGGDVRDVMIAGRWVVRERKLKTLDRTAVLREAAALGKEIAG
jgi:5-methylthioadenosine/S-adenosylhomocysteine deaminase